MKLIFILLLHQKRYKYIIMKTKIDIRRAIIERGYKIPAFAKKCGMSPVNLRENIIKGNPTVKKLTEICDVLDCDVTDLFYPIEEQTAEVIKQEHDKKMSGNDTEETTVHDLFTSDLFAPASEAEVQRIQLPEAEKAGRVTTFCPHCGARVRVGVVLLPE